MPEVRQGEWFDDSANPAYDNSIRESDALALVTGGQVVSVKSHPACIDFTFSHGGVLRYWRDGDDYGDAWELEA